MGVTSSIGIRQYDSRGGSALRFVSLVSMLSLAMMSGCGSQAPEASKPRARPSMHRTITVLPDPLPKGIHLSFTQQRLDEGSNRANVTVINGTHRILHVTGVGVDWPGYPGKPQRIHYPVPGQLTIDLRYRLPRAVCSTSAGSSPAYAVVTTPRRTIRRAMPAEGVRFLTRLWRTTCNERRIRRAATISFAASNRWTEAGRALGAVLHARLLLTRRATAVSVSVDQVQGSVLFDLRTPGGTMLPAGASQVSLPLDISPGRCDQHGRSQSQQTFVWRVWLKLADGEPIAQLVEPDLRQQARLLAFLDHACGKGG